MAKRKTILIVEDDRPIARGLSLLMTANGFKPIVAANGEDAIAAAKRSRPDVVLLDLQLPRLSGVEVCRRLRAGGFSAPVLMLTAQQNRLDKVLGLESGADDYVTKPFDPDELMARIRAQLRRVEAAGEQTQASALRRLTAVMFTDMKDFSKRMNRNESAALAQLKRHNTLIRQSAARHSGTIIETIGDAFVITFPSALEAVECGRQILSSLARYNQRSSANDAIRVRMGIHVGDIAHYEGGIKGNTVNTAARLQQLSAPGQILISQGVYDAVAGTARFTTKRLGARKLKNIKERMTVYKIA